MERSINTVRTSIGIDKGTIHIVVIDNKGRVIEKVRQSIRGYLKVPVPKDIQVVGFI